MSTKRWATECRIAEVSVDMSGAGKCYVKLEPVTPYMIEGKDRKGMIFMADATMGNVSILSCITPLPGKGIASDKNGEIRVYATTESKFAVAGCDCYAKAALLITLKTSRQKIRAWVDFAEKAGQKAETGDSTSDNVKAEEPKLICFTAI